MRFRIDRFVGVACAAWCSVACATLVSAQVGEVMDVDHDAASEENDEPRAARITARDPGETDQSADAEAESESEGEARDDGAPLVYRVGSDNGIEVGGHMFVNSFTVPSYPKLKTGLGFSGRVATRVYGDIIGEANVGIMFNKDSTDNPYRAASLRVGARYPIDLGLDSMLFFFGAGAALEFLSATTKAVGMTVMELDKSAITPAFDVQFGAIYDITDRFAIEVMFQGTYAFANVVWNNKDASWVALSGGVSYDL
jgi:hypothetical protein